MPRKRRVSMEARRVRVWRLKMAGGSDRVIAANLAADPQDPVDVSHKTVNQDWHAVLDELVEAEMGKGQQLRALAHQRYERLILAHWQAAVGTPAGPPTDAMPAGDPPAKPPDTRAAKVVQDAQAAIRALYGLDNELGDPERPLTIETQTVGVLDLTKVSDDDLAHLLRITDPGNGNIINGTGGVT